MRDLAPLPDLYSAEPIPEAAQTAIMDCLQSGDLFRYTTPQTSPVSELERRFAELMGCKYALAVSSCSAALFLSMRALDLPAGARVLIPAFTFAAVPSSVVHAGLVPVLVETGADFRIDLNDFDAKIADADAVLISHMRGQTSDMDHILARAAAHAIPVIEDAAHSLGTLWGQDKIGTMGDIGCFSFQSYKMLNGGEGGLLITDDDEIAARAVIMSGAYEHNWRHHPGFAEGHNGWQNRLPLYNMRMQNLSALVIGAQIGELDRRVRDGLRNHDRLAEQLNSSGLFHVPPALEKETRAPDSIQFNLLGFSDAEVAQFLSECAAVDLPVSVFGLSQDNARAFWNWEFLGPAPDLPKTRAMLSRACDLRLPARLSPDEVDMLADAAITAGMAATA